MHVGDPVVPLALLSLATVHAMDWIVLCPNTVFHFLCMCMPNPTSGKLSV